jgi:hypothetical protein
MTADCLKTTTLDKAQTDRHLGREDFEIQLEAARKSVERGNYAVARAELRGAILFLNQIEKHDGR